MAHVCQHGCDGNGAVLVGQVVPHAQDAQRRQAHLLLTLPHRRAHQALVVIVLLAAGEAADQSLAVDPKNSAIVMLHIDMDQCRTSLRPSGS